MEFHISLGKKKRKDAFKDLCFHVYGSMLVNDTISESEMANKTISFNVFKK